MVLVPPLSGNELLYRANDWMPGLPSMFFQVELRRIEVRVGDMMIRSRRMGRGCRLLVSLSVAVLVGLTRSSLAEVVSRPCQSHSPLLAIIAVHHVSMYVL